MKREPYSEPELRRIAKDDWRVRAILEAIDKAFPKEPKAEDKPS